MAKNQSPRRSDEEWFRLINECRRSGLSDSLWCKQQAIPVSSFFCAVRRLREKAYALPERERSIDIVSNPLPCQDVVRIDIEPNPFTVKADIVNIGLHFILKNVRPYAASCSEV